ncbi:zinc finger BED domain-containing 1-like [Paramuricea clavata]|uniref:Zinc finger BED domain-containing 1-like n=1 Tax=Paramuricea clavata TaxID=317549 RepID=A0A6S7LPQ1_PARCT|nr:zinc finger BED domain-containing 1-like [Paramuricea clavata]
MKRSAAWRYFDQDDESDISKVSCTICGEVLSRANNTSNLFKHLKCKHNSEYKTVDAEKKEQEKSQVNKRKATPKQMTMQSALGRGTTYPISSKRWGDITESLVGMIAKDMQPLSVVENEGFIKFVKELDPRYQLPSRSTITRSLLPKKYEKLKDAVKRELTQVKHVALTTNLWTSNQTLSYLTLTCHFIDHEMQLCSKVLETLYVQKDHTAPNLAEELKNIAKEWEITQEICCIITDNAANIVAAVNLLGWRHLPCFAHTLNLIVQDSLKAVSGLPRLQQKCKDIVTYFHRSTKATEKLLSMQSQANTTTKPVKLKQDVETRWNSTFYMMERLLKLREAVTTALCLSGRNDLCLTNSEFDSMQQIVSVLGAFEKATREMSSALGGSSTPVNESQSLESKLKAELKRQLKRRFSQLESNHTLSASTILDPRFKKIAFCSADTAERTIDRISSEACNIITNDTNESGTAMSASTTTQNNTEQSAHESDLWGSFDKKVAEASTHRSSSVESTVEIRRYVQEKNIPRQEDPLAWWKKHASAYPHLAELFKKYLCIPATSVPSERAFSKAGELVSKKRSNLKPSNIHMLLFLNNNM